MEHNMDIQYGKPRRQLPSLIYLVFSRHVARLRRRRRRRHAYAPTSNTASYNNHEKIHSWVSFSFPCYNIAICYMWPNILPFGQLVWCCLSVFDRTWSCLKKFEGHHTFNQKRKTFLLFSCLIGDFLFVWTAACQTCLKGMRNAVAQRVVLIVSSVFGQRVLTIWRLTSTLVCLVTKDFPFVQALIIRIASVITTGMLLLLKPNEISPYTNRNNH